MALTLESKKVIVNEVNSVAKDSIAIGVAEYSGLTVAQMTELRQLARGLEVSIRVVKNTLAKRAFVDTNCACVTKLLSGAVIIGFAKDAPGSVAKVFRDFAKDNDQLVVRGLGVAGEFIEASELNKISKLLTKDEAISALMALILAPVEKLAKILNALPIKLTRIVSMIRDQKQQ